MKIRYIIGFIIKMGLIAHITACSMAAGPGASESKSAGRRVGSLKGLESLEDIINERVYGSSSGQVMLSEYLESEERPSGLAALLGAFTEITGFSVQERAVPNAVNSLLWEKVSGSVAKELSSKACKSTNSQLAASFYEAAHRLCTASMEGVGIREDLEKLWMTVARYDAPENEMIQWIEDETGRDGIVSTSQGESRVAALLQSILMNPYFMLEH